ncbi:hypothetical protein FDZ71_06235 [bacterium]|nr:MAG: hypothetical protein FDZ71_06235 [bacterium]
MIKLIDLLADHQLYHSEFQQDYLITARAGGTTYGMYKQALRELFKRKRGLEELYSEKELLLIDIDELETLSAGAGFENRRNAVRLKQKRGHLYDMDKNIQDTEREFKRFYQQAAALKAVIGDLTDEKRKALDEDMWRYKLKEMAAIDWIAHGRLGNVTVEMLMAMPIATRKSLLAEIKNHNALIDWYENIREEPLNLPEVADTEVILE